MIRYVADLICDTPGCGQGLAGNGGKTCQEAVASVELLALIRGWRYDADWPCGEKWTCPACQAENSPGRSAVADIAS